MQRYFHARRATPTKQPCGNHPRVVEHQHVAGPEVIEQIGNAPVMQRISYRQQMRRVARIDRLLGDQMAGKRKIKESGIHLPLCSKAVTVSSAAIEKFIFLSQLV